MVDWKGKEREILHFSCSEEAVEVSTVATSSPSLSMSMSALSSVVEVFVVVEVVEGEEDEGSAEVLIVSAERLVEGSEGGSEGTSEGGSGGGGMEGSVDVVVVIALSVVFVMVSLLELLLLFMLIVLVLLFVLVLLLLLEVSRVEVMLLLLFVLVLLVVVGLRGWLVHRSITSSHIRNMPVSWSKRSRYRSMFVRTSLSRELRELLVVFGGEKVCCDDIDEGWRDGGSMDDGPL